MNETPSWMVYGANGYTGELVAREAVRQRQKPVISGRNKAAVESLGKELDLETRPFSLDDERSSLEALRGISTVLHCAGPFMRTSEPMVRACLKAGVHYLDITGEIPVFERIMSLGAKAQAAGVALVPGVGFDVVPTDCLAAILAAELPDATDLMLGFYSRGSSISRGTLKTMIESLPHAGAIRKDGRIVPVPIAFDVREIPFSIGNRWAMTIPWGDVSTAWHSTQIPNIRVYSATPRRTVDRMKRFSFLLPLFAKWPFRQLLLANASRRTGPDQDTRDRARVYLWGEVRNAAGGVVSATMDTPEGYSFTAVSAVAAALRVARGEVKPGSWTPSRAFGSAFAESLPDVTLDPVVKTASP